MAELPDQLDAGRHRDVPVWVELGARWTVLGLVAVIAIAALAGVFGQTPREATVAADAATLEVSAPLRLRGGLFYQGRFTVDAHQALDNVTLVLAQGWLENTSINTIEPSPTEETSRDGKLALSFGPLGEGERFVLYMQFQVNPTNVGRRDAGVELYDGDTLLATIDRTVTVFP